MTVLKALAKFGLLALSAAALSACSQTLGSGVDSSVLPEGPDSATHTTTCASTLYQRLVGQPIGEVHQASLPRPLRVYGQHDMVTQDHRPERLNIVVGSDDHISRVYCG